MHPATRYPSRVDRDEIIRVLRAFDAAAAPESRRPDFESFLRHCARYWAIAPKHYPRGVFKFRSIEEAQKARDKHAS